MQARVRHIIPLTPTAEKHAGKTLETSMFCGVKSTSGKSVSLETWIKQCQVSESIFTAENARAGHGASHFPPRYPCYANVSQFMFYTCCPSWFETPQDCISALVVMCSRKVTGLEMPSDIYPGDKLVRVKTVKSNKLEPRNMLWPHLTIKSCD